MRAGRTGKILVVVILAVAIAAFFVLDLAAYLDLSYLKSQQSALQDFYLNHPVLVIGIFSLIYVTVTALALPGPAILTLVGGAIFGLGAGVVIVSFASTFGATIAFLVSRFLLRDWVQTKFRDRLGPINKGMERDGAFYLLAIRLNPIFPFFVVNYAMGVTTISLSRYYLFTQLGALPGTLVFVNAGTQLAELNSLRGILDPGLIASFVVLSLFPLLAKTTIAWLQTRKLYRRFKRPKKYDYNLVVIGAGSAGLVTSYIAAAVRAKVALIEKHKMGGDCLNTGCVPSKALIRTARAAHDIQRAHDFGLKSASVEIDFSRAMERVQEIIAKIEPHDSIARYSSLGVDCIQGDAKVVSPFEVQVNGQTLTTRNIVLATGARPFVPALPGLDLITSFTSDTIWSLREKPKHLVILGAGPIGCELAQAFRRLGVEVTMIERGTKIMGREDDDASALVADGFAREGIQIRLGHEAKRIEAHSNDRFVVCQVNAQEERIKCDVLLIALGRRANVHGFGLEELGIRTTPQGTIETDEFLRTVYPNIFACGDAVGPFQFTHVAAHQAWYAAVNALFRPFRKFRADYRVIPWCTYTDPEVARVGLSEREAKERNIPYVLSRYGIDDLDRAICDSADHGFVKVLTAPGTDRILGATIAGSHAGDLLAEWVLAMKHGLGLNKILGTIHIYPTMAEANKYAAGVWKKQTAPQGVLNWVEKFHAFRRN